nr:GntR family transcriptional regulator [Micromonospora sp. DSM 115978]
MSGGPVNISKAELAYQAIRSRILDGTYLPGYRLVLSRLAGDLHISSLPVREALRRLEAEGLVDFTPNVGALVAGIDPNEYAETLQVLAIMEGAATAEAAPHLTGAQLAEARVFTAQMKESLARGDLRSFTVHNRSFHELICSGCPNTYLRTLLGREWMRLDTIRRSAFGMMPGRPEQSIDEHERIVALIEAGASRNEIERVAREHKLRTLRAFTARDAGAAVPT